MNLQEFRTFIPEVVFQEVPDHVSLAFSVSGCPLKCEGCHSSDTWNVNKGEVLTDSSFSTYLGRYQGLITCVLFFGGEWQPDQLIKKLKIAKEQGLKTCLYSGFEKLPKRITQHLDFLKSGPWRQELGGLSESTTNQVFVDMNSGETLNHRFATH